MRDFESIYIAVFKDFMNFSYVGKILIFLVFTAAKKFSDELKLMKLWKLCYRSRMFSKAYGRQEISHVS